MGSDQSISAMLQILRSVPRARVGISATLSRFRAPQRNFDAMAALAEASKAGASPEERERAVKKKYMQLAKQVHPDLHPDDKDAAIKFVALAQAFAQISGSGSPVVDRAGSDPSWWERGRSSKRSGYRWDDHKPGATRGRPNTEAEDWEARADWFFKNIS